MSPCISGTRPCNAKLAIFSHGAIVTLKTDRRNERKERGKKLMQSAVWAQPLCCFAVTSLDLAGQGLTVSCQLRAIRCQTCVLDSPGGLLTLDLELIGRLRKFPEWIGPFMLTISAGVKPFFLCIVFPDVYLSPFSFASSETHHFMWLGGRRKQGQTRASPIQPRWVLVTLNLALLNLTVVVLVSVYKVVWCTQQNLC